MEKQQLVMITSVAVIMFALSNVGVSYAMPNDYHTPEPIESLKVAFPVTGQSWHEITVFVNVCDARFNPNCDYGNRRAAMEYIPYTITIHGINAETKDLAFIEAYDHKTGRAGFSAVSILLDEKYDAKNQYLITVSTEDDIQTGKFWVWQKLY